MNFELCLDSLSNDVDVSVCAIGKDSFSGVHVLGLLRVSVIASGLDWSHWFSRVRNACRLKWSCRGGKAVGLLF